MSIYIAALIAVALLVGCIQPEQANVATAIPSDSDVTEPHRPTATEKDLAILDRADSLLASEGRWEQSANPYGCNASQDRYSLFCALLVASEDVLGAYEHRRPALEEVRRAIEETAGNKSYSRRLLDFNSDPEVTFQAVKSVLAKAQTAIRRRLDE